jgi:amidase
MVVMVEAATLTAWDATETVARLRKKDVSPAEVLEAAITRAEEARGLGAIVSDTFERARGASSVEGATLGGVPTFVKDLSQLEGVATTWGSIAGGAYVSRKTESFVRHLEEIGLVTLGKSATPELGLMATTEPLGRAPCRNPWDETRSTGGSSGGSAALVAAGVVPIAHASDGGGSIRIPAACCGLVGLKPSRSRIDMEGSNLLPINIATNGVVTRTVRDTILFYEALASHGVGKKSKPVVGAARETGKRRSLRIGLFDDSPTKTPVHVDVREAVTSAGRLCESLGHAVESIACPFEGSVIDDFLAYWGLVAWLQTKTAKMTLHWGFDRSRFEPWTNDIAATFGRSPRAALAAVGRLRAFGATYAAVLSKYDVLLGPTVAEPSPRLGYLATDQPFEQLFERLRTYCPFTPIQNAAGAPAISLPLGRSSDGMPIGVQLASARDDEATLLDLALDLEEASPWPQLAPRDGWRRARE